MEQAPQTPDPSFSLRFWGVRGSTPTPVARNLGHGGNTPCVAVETADDQLLIFDAGSGIRELGIEVVQRPQPPAELHLFFTHFHWDHMQGLPFFVPIYSPKTRLTIHSARPPNELREFLACQMSSPFFPVDFGNLASQLEFRQIGTEPQAFGGLTIQGFPLNHPQGAQGYRIAGPGKTIVFAIDHEHGNAEIDANLCRISHQADVLIYDAQYTAAEYPQRIGWGHGTWQEAVKVAAAAQVGQLVLFHHDPDHDDAALEAIVAEAQLQFPNTIAARERMTV